MKHRIAKLYTKHLMKKGYGIKSIYEKTKKFYGVPDSYWKKENGKWVFYGPDGKKY